MKDQLVYSLGVSFLIAFYSGLPGLWIAQIMRKKNTAFFYSLKNFELTGRVNFYKVLGLDLFAYCVKNTFFRHFNTKIRIPKRPKLNEVDQLLNEINLSELCHFFGFILVLLLQIMMLTLKLYNMFAFSLLFNTMFNVYPILLQERNKLRLRKFLIILQR